MASQPQQKYLPEDILMNVLCRLPVESLVRCRCVCKAWHHIISEPYFVTAHLAYQKTSSNKYILYDGFFFFSLLADIESIFDETYKNFEQDYPFDEQDYPQELSESGGTDTYRDPKIYGISNGLLCFSNEDYCMGDDIYLYNPGCRKIKKLPKLDISEDDAGFTKNAPALSFGYYDEDYKVVVIAPVGKTYTVYVYSLANNSWKTIHTNFNAKNNDDDDDLPSMETKFVNNTVYALTSALVICFNLSDETIRVVDFPVELISRRKTMEACGETIAVFEYQNNHNQYSLNMWILRDEFSSKPTWQNLFGFVFDEACGNADVMGMLDNGKYIIRTENDAGSLNTFFLWDLDSQELTEFRSMSAALDSVYSYGRIHSDYVESLLLLNEDSVDSDW